MILTEVARGGEPTQMDIKAWVPLPWTVSQVADSDISPIALNSVCGQTAKLHNGFVCKSS